MSKQEQGPGQEQSSPLGSMKFVTGESVVHVGTGQRGTLEGVSADRNWATFVSTTGARFPVHRNEVREQGYQLDELEKLLVEKPARFFVARGVRP